MQTIATKKRKSYILISYVVAIVLGLISGMSDVSSLQGLGIFISDVFIKIFKCVSLPIIALSLIVTLSQFNADRAMQRIWKRTIVYTLSTTVLAACIACGLYLIIQPANVNTVAQQGHLPSINQEGYLGHLAHLIPSNIFSPFMENQVLSVLLIALIVGIAIRFIKDDDARKMIGLFFKGAHGIFLVITGWIVVIIPLGLYGFITATVVQLRAGMDLKGIEQYLSIVVLANLIQGFLVLPLWLRAHNIKPFHAMKAMFPALSVAFFMKSSVGSLPITIETVEKNLGVNPKISRFVLPLCTAINMNGCAAFIFTTVIFLMQNDGVVITFTTLLTWILIATIAAIGNAGVPMGCFFLSASLLASMNIPITLLGVILPFYGIIDMIETALNVWSDSCVAKVVDTQANQDAPIGSAPLDAISFVSQ